jgi:lipopolysaccharide export LptBFGC system permease protein LptF
MDIEREIAFEKANHYGAIALVFLTIALTCFSVGVFSANPESVLGIVFLILGIIFVLTSYVFFALYGHFSKKQ